MQELVGSWKTLEDCNIFDENETSVHIFDKKVKVFSRVFFKREKTIHLHKVHNKVYGSCSLLLYSDCEDCDMDDCPHKKFIPKRNIRQLSQKHRNAYLILCQKFSLPSDIIEHIEDNHEDDGVRLGDVLHHICHKNPNLTQEEVIEIISNGKLKLPERVPPAASLYLHCKDCRIDYCSFKNLVDEWNMHELSQKHGNAYLILCQKYGLSSDIIKAIEHNHKESHIRLDDVLHHICHKNPNLTQEEVNEIISNYVHKLQEPEISQRESAGNGKDQSETSTRNVYSTRL